MVRYLMSSIQPIPLTHKLIDFHGWALLFLFLFSLDLMILYINNLMQFCFDLSLLFLVVFGLFLNKRGKLLVAWKASGFLIN